MGKMSGVMQAQSNQLAFLSHTIGSSRAERDQEMEEMRKAMEESIRQRVAEEAGTNPKHEKTYNSMLKLALPAFCFLWL